MTELNTAFIASVGFIITVLLAGNGYFIKRLVDKVESASVAAIAVNTVVVSMADQLRDIRADLKGLRTIEIDVAVLKAMFGAKTNKSRIIVNGEDEIDDSRDA